MAQARRGRGLFPNGAAGLCPVLAVLPPARARPVRAAAPGSAGPDDPLRFVAGATGRIGNAGNDLWGWHDSETGREYAVASITMSALPQIHGATNIVVAKIATTHNIVVHALQRIGLAYLGCYTDGTAIARQRPVKFDGEHVRFRWRDCADGNRRRDKRRRDKRAGFQAKSTRWAKSADRYYFRRSSRLTIALKYVLGKMLGKRSYAL